MDLPLSPLTVNFRLDPKNITENPKFGKIPSCQIRKVLIFWTRRVWHNRISPYFLDKTCLAKTRKSLFLSKKKSPYFKQTSGICMTLLKLSKFLIQIFTIEVSHLKKSIRVRKYLCHWLQHITNQIAPLGGITSSPE